MKIPTRTRYGMRFMIDMAEHHGQGCIVLKDVAERQGISKKYLEQVVAPLSRAGLLTVTRGYLGGYQLARDPETITLADIMSASEDGLNLLECTEAPENCDRATFCRSRNIWLGLENAMRAYLEGFTLADVVSSTIDADELLKDLVEA